MKPILVWRVSPDDGGTVAAVAKAAGIGGAARAFVNGRRADGDHVVEAGDRVEFFAVRQVDTSRIEIVAKRDGVLLVTKPAGVPTEPTPQGEQSVVAAVLAQLKGGHVHAASRLDTMVSGLVMITLGRNAARRVEKWRARRQVLSTYYALCQDVPSHEQGTWDLPLGKGRNRAGKAVARTAVANQKSAVTKYRLLAQSGPIGLLKLQPETGRFHQLRAHAAAANCPLVGDVRYGGSKRVGCGDGRVAAMDRIALHCGHVRLPGLRARTNLPHDMVALWVATGGCPEELALCLEASED